MRTQFYALDVVAHSATVMDCEVTDAKGRRVFLYAALFEAKWEPLPPPITSIWAGERGTYGTVTRRVVSGEEVSVDASDAVFFDTPEARQKHLTTRVARIKRATRRARIHQYLKERKMRGVKERRARLAKIFQSSELQCSCEHSQNASKQHCC